MSITDSLFKTIVNGKEGRNIGIPSSMPKIDKITYGIQRGYITTIFADSGAGKTTYALYSYVYQPLMYALENDKEIAILYFSFEMSSEVLFAKLLSLHLYSTYKKVVSFEEILSLTEVIDDSIFELIVDSKAWLETIEKYITVIDKAIDPEQISVVLRMWNEKFGKFVSLDNDQEEYVPNNRDIYKIVLIDHVKLVKANNNSKQAIDNACDHLIYYRNKCNITGVLIQQANRQSKSMDRRLNGYNMLQLDDMSDSSGPAQASEVVIGIYHPHREKLNKIDGYNVKILGDRIRVIQVLKNRYGKSDKNVCVSFYGEIGWFRELPSSESISDYESLLDLETQKATQTIIEEPTEVSPFTFTL